jgi:hypothetical protein
MSPRMPDPDTAARMDAIAAGLAAAGLAAQVHDTHGVLDITANAGPASLPVTWSGKAARPGLDPF